MNILSLGEKIKKLRKSKNMTLKELAGERITAAQISHIERDKSHTSYELLEYIAEKLEVTTDYLLETKEMQAKKMTENLIIQSNILIKSNELEKAKECANLAIKICIEYSVHENYARGHYILGEIALKENDYNESIAQYEKSIYYFIKNADNENVFRGYVNIGKIYIEDKFYKGALLQLEIANKILPHTSIEDEQVYRELYSNLAYCSVKLKDSVRTKKYIEMMENLEIHNNSSEKIELLMLKGSELFNIGEFDKSKEYFSKVLELLDRGDASETEVDVYLRICDTYRDMCDFDNVLKYSQKVYSIKRQDEDYITMRSIYNIIDAAIELEDYEMATQYCKIALTISIKKKNKEYEHKVLKLYAEISICKDELNSAIQYLTKSLEIAKQLENKKAVADLSIKLGELYADISKDKELEYYQQGIEIYKQLEII